MHFSDLLANQRQYFKAQHTKTLAARNQSLQLFRKMLLENESRLYEAVNADFQKSEHEAFLTEWAILIKDIDEALGALPKWMKAQKVRTNLDNGPVNQTQRSGFVNNTYTTNTNDLGAVPQRQSLSQALKPKADNGDQGGFLPPNPPPPYSR